MAATYPEYDVSQTPYDVSQTKSSCPRIITTITRPHRARLYHKGIGGNSQNGEKYLTKEKS